MPQSSWWFILGHEPLLSLAEVHAALGKAPVLLTKDIARVELDHNPAQLINQLGGTIKIAKELDANLTEEALLDRMALELEGVFGKIHFGLSLYAVPQGSERGQKWGLTLKKRLKEAGKSVRYVDNRGKAILSSVSVDKNGLVDRGREFLIIPMQHGSYGLAQAVSVQPFESFSERDFGRPGRDDVSGMLPPKLAIMMINCAGISNDKILYDPSCGSGTILSEAMLLGYTKLVGSDVSPKAVDDTKQNIAWTREQQSRGVLPIIQSDPPTGGEGSSDVNVFEHDIQKPPTAFDPKDLGGIVSEPFMGPPLKGRETLGELQKSAAELAQLYLKTFRSFASFLPKGSSVVYIFPRFSTAVRTSDLVIPEIKKLGFKVVPLLPPNLSKEPFVLYQRENQRVGREIWKFTF